MNRVETQRVPTAYWCISLVLAVNLVSVLVLSISTTAFPLVLSLRLWATEGGSLWCCVPIFAVMSRQFLPGPAPLPHLTKIEERTRSFGVHSSLA